MKKFSLAFLLLCSNMAVFAQTQPAEQPVANTSFSISITDIWLLVLFIFTTILLLVSIVLYNAFKVMLKEQMYPNSFIKEIPEKPLPYEEWYKQRKTKPNFWTKILELKPIEKEREMMIPHIYDGIQELNNPVPKWFNVLFYGTMIFGVCYYYYYHIGEYGERQDQEYETELVKAEQDKRLFLAKSVNKIDESTVKVDKSFIENGKTIYMANCVACHGEHGQGLVGPNLTDDFWIHGGSINDIFKTIKYGVPDKGMVSWEKSLSPQNIAEVTNYVLSLQGSNPAGAKAPQGEKYVPKEDADSTKNESATSK